MVVNPIQVLSVIWSSLRSVPLGWVNRTSDCQGRRQKLEARDTLGIRQAAKGEIASFCLSFSLTGSAILGFCPPRMSPRPVDEGQRDYSMSTRHPLNRSGFKNRSAVIGETEARPCSKNVGRTKNANATIAAPQPIPAIAGPIPLFSTMTGQVRS